MTSRSNLRLILNSMYSDVVFGVGVSTGALTASISTICQASAAWRYLQGARPFLDLHAM